MTVDAWGDMPRKQPGIQLFVDAGLSCPYHQNYVILKEAMVINLEGVVAENWRDIPAKEIFPGIRKHVLWQGTNGVKAQILEFDADTKFTTLDTHAPGPEEVFVISGVFNDGVHDYPVGTFIHNPAGSAHIPQSKEGCVIFVLFPEG